MSISLESIPISEIETNRLYLRKLDTSFCSDEYVFWMNDPKVNQYLESGSDYTKEKLWDYLSDVEMKHIFFWAIIVKATGKHIGNIKIDPINTRHGLGEYGILMGDRNEWGKGYAFEASKAVIDFCFSTLKLRKVTLGVVEDNHGAVSLYKKLGFVTEGLFKNHGIYNGKFCNTLRMSFFSESLINN